MFSFRNYKSDETYDLGKYLDFKVDVYDVINSPFLLKLKQLPVVAYYEVDKRYRDIDLISVDAYGSSFLTFYIQFYNDIFDTVMPEGTTLKLFSIDDLNKLCSDMSLGNI